jgi:hypothetical protein
MNKTPEQIERAYELYDFLEENPDSHNQSRWVEAWTRKTWEISRLRPVTAADVLNVCGATACAAGWACLLAGGKFVSGHVVVMPDGSQGSAMGVAASLLGLSEDEAYVLFEVADDLSGVLALIVEFFGPDSRPR